MEDNQNKQAFEDMKTEIIREIECIQPDLRDVMLNKNNLLRERRLENMAEYVARHCDVFDENEKDFAKCFIMSSIYYLNDCCNNSDFIFDSLYQLATTTKLRESYDVAVFEMILEDAVEKCNNEHKKMLLETIRICNAQHINPEFTSVIWESIMKYKELFLESMLNDDQYEKSVQRAKEILDFLNKNPDPKLKELRTLIEQNTIFKLVDYEITNQNPFHDYDKFRNCFVQFETVPQIGISTTWKFMCTTPFRCWTTSTIQDIDFTGDILKITTKNTSYVFQKAD